MNPHSVLKIDKDLMIDEDWLEHWIKLVIRPVAKRFGARVRRVQVHDSLHKGFHTIVTLDRLLPPNVENELQFLMGDDSVRVSLNRARIASGLQEWNKLWAEPDWHFETVYKTKRRRKNG